jgi:transcriptional regulator with XRE-family HTH domain
MIEIDIGRKIADGRRAKNLSQEQMAGKLFVSKQAVGKWERNESIPDILMLSRVGEIIGHTDLNYFLGEEIKICKCDNKCDCCK